MDIANRTIETLEADAQTAPRFLAICYTQMAHAKRALLVGDKMAARTHLEASKRAWLRSQEDEHGQVKRVERTALVVRGMGAEQPGVTTVGKNVVKLRTEKKAATWPAHWAR